MDSHGLLEVLKCEFCNNYLLGTIFMCSNGHSCCENCKEKRNTCRSCYKDLVFKNAAVMNIVENFGFSCKTCDKVFMMKDFLIHLKKLWTCHLCDEICIPIEDSADHLMKAHKAKQISFKKKGKICITSKEKVYYCYYKGSLFVFIHKKAAKNVSVFTSASERIYMRYNFGENICHTHISPQKIKILSSSKQLGSNYILEFEIDKINT